MRVQEVQCFARAVGSTEREITTHDLLTSAPSREQLDSADIALIGGSGDYSAAGESPWLDQTFAALRNLVEEGKPTFASCWGFQAIARALGGRCIHDPANAELGPVELQLTDQGRADPLFSTLPDPFDGHAGHEDHVVELPPEAVLLASSQRVRQQAFRIEGTPIYCTQFHPELDRRTFLQRVAAYPRYVESIAGVPYDVFAEQCRETPEANQLIRRFVTAVRDGALS